MATKRLGEKLVEAGLISTQAVDQALAQQKISGLRLGDCLVDLGLIQEAALLRFLAGEFKTKFVSAEKLAKARIAPDVLNRVPVRMAEQQCFIPLAHDPERKLLSVVMSEPQNVDLIREIQVVTAMDEVFAYISLRSAILAAIRKHYYGDPTAFAALEAGGVGALRNDVSTMQRAYEVGGEASRILPTPLGQRGTSGRVSPTQLGEQVGLAKGSVPEQDFIETLDVLVGLLELQRKHFNAHSAQLARQTTLLGRRLGLQPRELGHLAIAAYLHDLGSTGRHLTLATVAANPELKPVAKQAVRAPLKLFEGVHLSGGVNTILAQRFEAFDGSGLPQGAKGDEIAAGARVLSAVDDFLDLTRNPDNPKGQLLGKDEALQALRQGAGTLYDPRILEALEQLTSGDLLRQRLITEGRLVLLVEPDEATRTALAAALARVGLPAQGLLKLDGVLDSLRGGIGDVICAGLGLGAAELASLVQWVRSRPEHASIPIVVLGEPTDPQSKDRLVQVGATQILPAPNDPDRVAEHLKALYLDRIANGGPGRVVRGSFDELQARDVARLLGAEQKSGRLMIRAGTEEGFVHLERGRIIAASFGGEGAESAVWRLFSIPHAEFQYEPEALPHDVPQLDLELETVASRLVAAAAG